MSWHWDWYKSYNYSQNCSCKVGDTFGGKTITLSTNDCYQLPLDNWTNRNEACWRAGGLSNNHYHHNHYNHCNDCNARTWAAAGNASADRHICTIMVYYHCCVVLDFHEIVCERAEDIVVICGYLGLSTDGWLLIFTGSTFEQILVYRRWIGIILLLEYVWNKACCRELLYIDGCMIV